MNDHLLVDAFARNRLVDAFARNDANTDPAMLIVDAGDIVRALRASNAGLRDAIARAALRVDRIYAKHNKDTLASTKDRRCVCRAPNVGDDSRIVGDIAENAGWGLRYTTTCEVVRYAMVFHALEHMCIARGWDFASVVHQAVV